MNFLRPGHNVLIWGASGGLGSMAVQLCATAGANAIGVISDESKRRILWDNAIDFYRFPESHLPKSFAEATPWT